MCFQPFCFLHTKSFSKIKEMVSSYRCERVRVRVRVACETRNVWSSKAICGNVYCTVVVRLGYKVHNGCCQGLERSLINLVGPNYVLVQYSTS